MTANLSALRVLLVDDNKNMRTIVESVLKALGVRYIRHTPDGSAALMLLREFEADVAIVDFQMFPMDGVEFTRLVRQSSDSRNPYLPIIMCTGYAEEHRVHEARDAGVTEFLVKPINAAAIVNRLNAVIFKPRPFVKADQYFGPDRRRRATPGYAGPWRREGDAAEGRADAAGKLVAAARDT